MGQKRHQHLVTKSYQRAWADSTDRIWLVDKSRKTTRHVGIADAFVSRHFNSVLREGGWKDVGLEDAWGEVENRSIPLVRALLAGDRSDPNRHAIRELAALHFVRSGAHDRLSREFLRQVLTDMQGTIGTDKRAIAAFSKDRGRPPEAGELEALALVAHDDGVSSRALFVGSLATSYNRAMEILAKLRVQICTTGTGTAELILGDQPLVHCKGDQVSILEHLALGDGEFAFFPIGPGVAACFTAQRERDAYLNREGVHRLNGLTWRAAVRYVAARPGAQLNAALPGVGIARPDPGQAKSGGRTPLEPSP